MTSTVACEDYAPQLARAFAGPPWEGSQIPDVEGELPAFVDGTLFMNGPAHFARGGIRYRHWLDGDGMVCALRVDRRGVHLTTRYVNCRRHAEEVSAERAIFRAFGTAFSGDRLCRIGLESPINVSVFPYCGRLLAFGEQGLPWDLDPSTLETRGPFTFSGALNEISPFSAHAKIDTETGELFNIGVSFSTDQPILNAYRFDSEARQIYRRRLPLPYVCSIHDFSLARRHLLIHISPYLLDISRVLEGGASLLDAMSWHPEWDSRLWILDRESGRLLCDIGLPATYVLHHAAAAETAEGIALDVLELDEPVYAQYMLETLFEDIGPGRPVRLVVDPDRGECVNRLEHAYSNAPDFPSTDAASPGAPYSRLWMLGISNAGRRGRKFFDELVQVDWQSLLSARMYRAPGGSYMAGEPVFIGDPGDASGGAVICPMLDPDQNRTVFGFFDACAIEAGPIARVIVRPALHAMFHGVFVARAADDA